MRFSSIVFLLLTSCGYQWVPHYPFEERPSITVPFIAGDEDGSLTNEIIRTISRSGIADVVHSKGNYCLQVSIVGSETSTIGYRRDKQKITGEIKKNLVASEGRKEMTIEAVLLDGDSEIVYGPYRITDFSDYDYVDGDSVQDLTFINSDGILTTVLPFSLGQLEPIESAQEATTRPLYARLAQKIVDAICSEW